MQIIKDDSISIMGRSVALKPVLKREIKTFPVGEVVSYDFYEGNYQGKSYVFASPKGRVPSPAVMAATAQTVRSKTGKDVVFVLPTGPSYLRQRLIDKGVYFVVSRRFAFLPDIIINERQRTQAVATKLTPVAQYLLLYHLQLSSIEGLSAREIANWIPYSYPSVTQALQCLEDVGLAIRVPDGTKNKIVKWNVAGRELWDRALPLMMNPVQRVLFADEVISDLQFPTCGINALAHYSRLNPDPERMIAISAGELKNLIADDLLEGQNSYDGNYRIEVWKYPPVTKEGYAGTWVDALSLALSLREDKDPRVENEVEYMLDNIEWKG
ncbi:MAG: hypothetical protein LIP02_06165 [Bacteroidales bacterium]|nr:hypothetical protein [Bacteroidales bacterium]